jgi:hypothetical protein
MRELVDKILGAETNVPPHPIENTGWLDQTPLSEFPKLQAEYIQKFDGYRQRLEATLGTPVRATPSDAAWFATWYPEAFAAAAWFVDGKYLCVAAEHADRETPMCIVLFATTDGEIAERAASSASVTLPATD